MPKINFIIVAFLWIQISGLSGQKYSLSNILAEKNDSLKCEKLISASEHYKYQSVDTMLLVAEALYATAEKLKSQKFLENACNIKSTALKFKGQFPSAIEYAQKALDLNAVRKDEGSRAIILLNYADLMRQQKQYDASERYHREGILLSNEHKDSTLMAKFYINSGLMFADMGKLDSAAHYYKYGISITDKVFDLQNIGVTARLNLSQLAEKQGKYEEMISLAMQVYEYGADKNDADHISLGANNVAMGYLKLGNFDKALAYVTRAEDAAKKYRSPQNLLYALGNASDIYAEKGDFKSAYLKALAYIGLKDSLRTALYDQNLLEITTKYELKEKETLLAQHQLTITKQSTRQRMILWISAILILTGILIFLYLKNRQDLQRKTAEVEAEKAQLKAQLEHAEVERLQELENVRNKFFANISHEFRTPLTLILNPAEQLMKDGVKSEHKKYLNIIQRNAARLMELVNQLLDLSKLESGKASLKVELYDLRKFCRTICGLFDSLASHHDIEMKLEFPEKDLIVWFDKDVVEKILVNLLSNAFKYTPTGGEIHVKLTGKSNGAIEIAVTDTGIGIPKENIENLFDRYLSFSGSDLQSSSGIGLSLVHELVQLHKGHIEVQSESGVGSVFTIRIPVSKEYFSEDEISTNNAAERQYSGHLPQYYPEIGSDSGLIKKLPDHYSDHKPVLLVAEDNPDVRFLITDICKDQYQVIAAENGNIAQRIAIEKIPDIIITDVMMPEMDGTELCAALRSNEITSHIPIIMLTARGDQKDKLTGLKTGADDYLTKPFDAEELKVRLQNLLEQRKILHNYFKKVLHTFTSTEVKVDSMDTHFVKNLKTSIENNIHKEHYGVTELAADLALSRSQLHRKVTGLLGYSPNEVIRNMRLEKARMMIQKKAGTIAEIAYNCGFNSPAYFSKCFKDYFGHTAGEEY